MNRRAFITMVGASLLAASIAVEAQPSRIPRIGVLAPEMLRLYPILMHSIA